MKYRFLPAARVELLESTVWILENTGTRHGVQFVASVEDSIQLILENPQAFKKVRGDIRGVRLRKYPYKIWYQIVTDEVIIIAISHCKRRPDYWTDRVE